ncbi:SurA N-terminal domain-containing protein [Thetidibacter halocola]|uniref:SurA N-terminal domain-containing protein n=1 Tax=Thetidibacter halocola TaxID=2827239 RepID=A0A8J7WCS2_9RHOB|nr:SurA N-terminal domain-containing protein [Thetidibacter halocola]MBS0122773.1 SurA N-terminal domain-containing protein [Thetidibacter halocola]
MTKRKGSIGRTAIWILLGLLIVGLAGFGTTNFSGNVRSIGAVGETEIDITEYSRALDNEMQALQAQTGQPVTFPQAQTLGLPQQVLAQLVVTAALEDEARRIGLSAGDERVAEQLSGIQAFRGQDGQFSRDAYAFALRNAGLTEQEFEESLRSEAASAILQGAVLAGTALPDTYTNTLVSYALEERSVTWARLGDEALTTGLPVPSEDDLRAYYEANIDAFTLPLTKVLTFAWLTPEMIVDSVEVDEAALRAAYEERAAEFNLPERRLVERLVMADEAAAQAALDRIAGGERFEALVAERGLRLSDTDLGDVTLGDLGAAGDAVFGAEVGAIVTGPSDLGPALFRVNAVLAAQETPFEEAVPMMRDELALDRARRVIEGQAQSLEDELAAGATLEDLAQLTDMDLGKIDWTGAEAEGIAGYEAFRAAADAVVAGDFPTIAELGDGGVFALRLDEIREPAPEPFDDARDRVEAAWEVQVRTDALVTQAETLRAQLAEGVEFAALGLASSEAPALTRSSAAAGLPAGLVERAFTMTPGEVAVLPGNGAAILIRLDSVTAADLASEGAEAVARFYGDQAASAVAQDLFRALASDIQTRAGVVIDQAAINAVHANMR